MPASAYHRRTNTMAQKKKAYGGKRKAHPGFAGAAASVERREGVSKERADAIIAAGARKASAGAKRSNPRLNRVKG